MASLQKRLIWAAIAFSLIVLAVILLTTVNEETVRALMNLNLFFLLLAFGLRIISLVFWAFRIQVLSASLGYRVRFRPAFLLVLVNLFAGAVTPGQAGGEPVRVAELYRQGVKVGDATAVVILERILDAVVLTIMGVIAMVFLGGILTGVSPGLTLVMIAGWIFMGGILVLVALAAWYPSRSKAILMRGLRWLAARFRSGSLNRIIERADAEADIFFCGIRGFVQKERRYVVFGSLCTALFWASEFFVASLLLMSLGQPPFIAESYLFQLVIAVVMMVPLTPGSSGIAEVSATSLYAFLIPGGVLGIFVLLWRILFFYFNIAIGLIAGLFMVNGTAIGDQKDTSSPPGS